MESIPTLHTAITSSFSARQKATEDFKEQALQQAILYPMGCMPEWFGLSFLFFVMAVSGITVFLSMDMLAIGNYVYRWEIILLTLVIGIVLFFIVKLPLIAYLKVKIKYLSAALYEGTDIEHINPKITKEKNGKYSLVLFFSFTNGKKHKICYSCKTEEDAQNDLAASLEAYEILIRK